MTIRVGIIGCGKIAQVRHIPEYAANPHTEVYGFYDINLARAEELAEKYNGKAYASYEELLADPAIEAVSVCAANHVHAEITVAALKAGKHVLCEKPMAVTLEECEAMVAAARESGKYLMIGQNQRLAKAHAKAKELIEQGAIGKVLTFRTIFGHGGPETWSITPGKGVWFFDKKQAVMGSMADLGIHKTDLIRFLLDQDVVRTSARVLTLDKRGMDDELIAVDDNAMCIYEMSGGTYGTMTTSWSYYGAEDNSTILYGTKGIMRIYDNPDHSIVIKFRDGVEAMYDVEQIQTNDNQTSSGVIDEYVAAIVENRPSTLDATGLINSMHAVFASLESSEGNGAAVDVK